MRMRLGSRTKINPAHSRRTWPQVRLAASLRTGAGFAFITSAELIALASGKTVSPRRNIFWPGKFNAANFFSAYITILIFETLYVLHKVFFKTPIGAQN